MPGPAPFRDAPNGLRLSGERRPQGGRESAAAAGSAAIHDGEQPDGEPD
jgi:hypothetical protein